MAGELQFVDQAGQPQIVPADQAPQAQAAGWRPVTDPAELEKLRKQQEYDTAGGMAKSFGLGAASMLPGAVPALIGSGVTTPENAQAMQDVNPGMFTAGQVTGVVAPALATAGTSAEAEGLGAAADAAQAARATPSLMRQVADVLPTNLLAKAGEGVEGAVAKAVGEGVGGRALAGAARGALEAPAYAVNDLVNEDYIQDKPFTGEALVATLGPSAFFGAAGGGALGAGIGLAHEYAPRFFGKASEALDALSERAKPPEFHAPEAPDIIPSVEVPAGPAAVAAPVPREAPAPFVPKPVPDAASANRAVRAELTGARQKVEGVLEQLYSEDKPRMVRQLLGDANQAEPVTSALIQDVTNKLEAVPFKSDSLAKVKALLAETGDKAAAAPNDAERFLLLDKGKSKADRLLKFDKQLSPEQNATLQPVRDAVGAWRSALEDRAVWGKAAQYQEDLNGRLSDYFKSRDALETNFFAKAKTPEELDAGRMVVDPKKVSSFLRARSTMAPESDRVAASIQSYVDHSKGLLQHLEDSTYSELPSKVAAARSTRDALGQFSTKAEEAAQALAEKKAALRENVAGAKSAAKAMRDHARDVEGDVRQHARDVARNQSEYQRVVAEAEKRSGQQVRQQAQEYRQQLRESKGAFKEAQRPGLLAEALHHVPLVGEVGRFALAGASAIAGRPIAGLSRQREVISALAKKSAEVSESISKGVRSVLAGVGGKPTSSAIGALASHHWGTEPPRGEGRPAAAARHAEDLAQLQADPAGSAQRLASATSSVARHAPDTAGQAQIVASRAASYLAAQAPKNPLPPSPFKGAQKWMPPHSDVERFERIAQAVHNPMGVLDALREGRASPDAIQAVQAVYPSLHKRMVDEVVAQIPGLKSAPPASTRLGLSILTGMPLEPSLRDMAQLQTNYAGGPPAQSGGMPRPNQKGLGKLGMASRSAGTLSTLTGSHP